MSANQKYLLFACKGLLVMLQECVNGRNIHSNANMRQIFIAWINLLERDNLSDEAIEQISQSLPRVSAQARDQFRSYLELKQRGASHE